MTADKCKAWIIDSHVDESKRRKRISLTGFEPGELEDGEGLVKVAYSSINYKDALAVTGSSKVLRTDDPIVPGIDQAGTVAASRSPSFSEGDEVIATGWELGERFNGGYAQFSRVKDWMLVKRPEGFSALDAMSIGTAGFTAALAVLTLQDAGCLEEDSKLLVTSAGGGLGSVAVTLLSALKHQVYAVSRERNREYIKSLGAQDIIDRAEFTAEIRALGPEKWDGAIDTAGGKLLEALLPQLKYGSTVASCGLTAGAGFQATVMPLIIRAVRIVGIDSVQAPGDVRARAWELISSVRDDLHRFNVEIIPFSGLVDACWRLINAEIQGRLVLKVAG